MNSIRTLRRGGGMLLCALLLFPLALGCGRPKGTVIGKVTYKGKAVEKGFVTFVPGKGTPVNAEIQSDGSYRAENVPVGEMQVCIQPPQTMLTEPPSKTMPKDPKEYKKIKEAMKEGKKRSIPQKYATPGKSELAYTVKEGSQNYDIDLK